MSDKVDASSMDATDDIDAKPMKAGEPGLTGAKHMGGDTVTMTKEEFYADEYKMNHRKRGQAVIINNKTFNRSLGLGERTGTDQDAVALSQRFSEMGFDVFGHQDCSVSQMVQVLGKAASNNDYNSQSDAFICAILSHGEEGVVFGTDAKVEIQDLVKPFKGSSSTGLIGKPKIFFIQACQGANFDAGVGVNMADAKGHMPMEQEVQVHKIPSEADFLIAYSVVPGYFSWRNSANGSWFVQALSEVLAKNWKKMDLLTMMTRVNKKVAYEFESRTGKEFMNEKKQIPCITSMLTKEVRFQLKSV